jgi:hypothetical protein
MYLIYGLCTIVLGIATVLVLPDNPMNAKFCFSRLEKAQAIERVRANQTGIRNSVFKREQMFETMLDYRTWLIVVLVLAANMPTGAVQSYSTTLIKRLRMEPSLLLLSSPPFRRTNTYTSLAQKWIGNPRYKFIPLIQCVTALDTTRSNLLFSTSPQVRLVQWLPSSQDPRPVDSTAVAPSSFVSCYQVSSEVLSWPSYPTSTRLARSSVSISLQCLDPVSCSNRERLPCSVKHEILVAKSICAFLLDNAITYSWVAANYAGYTKKITINAMVLMAYVYPLYCCNFLFSQYLYYCVYFFSPQAGNRC